MDQDNLGTGRRKRAVATVRMRAGKGQISVNGKKFEEYFPSDLQRRSILTPLEKSSVAIDQFDILVRLKGGGVQAQALAMRLGISRALVGEDESRRALLKEVGYLTRDPRKKERKKYGLKKARKRFQFSKR